MVVLVAAAALGAALVAPAAGDDCQRRARRCSTPPSPRAKAQTTEARLVAAARLAPGEKIVVPVAYHVVYGSYRARPSEEPDDLAHAPPLALTQQQTKTLNRAFRGTGFSFRTVETTLSSFARWDDPERAVGDPPSLDELMPMIRDLTANRHDMLHVFLMRRAPNRAAPAETKSMFESELLADGIMMDWDYLPYVEALRPNADRILRRYYFEGDTLVHLVGHYAGLLDTFQEDESDCWFTCADSSDFVSDTPAHRWTWDDHEELRCIPLDTCPGFPGMDPITNYMNLEPDLCASEFTPGQIERMERMVRTFRPNLIVRAPSGAQ